MLGSQMKRPVRLPMRLILSIAGLVVFSAPAVAQEANTLVADLRKGVPCSGAPAAKTAMEANIGKASAVAADVDAALSEIAANQSICSALRDAAREIGTARVDQVPGSVAATDAVPDTIAISSREAVAAALAEAERRAANLKFEVGPPPPNLTKGRNSGP